MKIKNGEIMLLITAIIWGMGVIASQLAIDSSLSTFQILLIRFLVGTLVLSIVFYKRTINIKKKELIAGGIIGIFLFLAFALQTLGLKYTTPSMNAFLTATYVVMVPFLAWIILSKKPDKFSMSGAILALIGLSLLTMTNTIGGIGKGDIITIFSALGFALHLISAGYYAKIYDPIKLSIIQIGTALVLSIPTCLYFGFDNISYVNISLGLSSSIFLGIFSTSIGFLLQNIAQKKVSETKTSIILSLEAVFGTLLSVFFLKEELTFNMICGFLIIFIAIIITETKLSFLFKNKEENISS